MKKPQLCLALSVSIALLQANLLPAISEPASPTIWQKLAGVNASVPVKKTGSAAVRTAKQAPHVVSRAAKVTKATTMAHAGAYSAHGVAFTGMDGYSMLFLMGRKESASPSAPAAALTIHPSLPLTSEVAAAPAVTEAPTLVAMNDVPVAQLAASGSDSKPLVAQLAPDQVVAQAEPSATPIPPAVSGTVDLEEFKTSNVIDLKVSQSRTFKLKNKIVRTSISDPSIAEPVVVAENQLVMLGKAPGGATLVIWDDAGNSVAVDIRVSRDYGQLQATLREIDPRIIVKPFAVAGGDRVILTGDVDHPESVIRAFTAANAFMDDRGSNIVAANGRLLEKRIGEQSIAGGGQQAGGAGGSAQLSRLSVVDTFTFFSNLNNNVSKAEAMVSDGGRVTSLVRVRKTPLIALHVTFMEVNSAAARELAMQLGWNFTSQSFSFGVGGNPTVGAFSFLQSTTGVNGNNGQPFPENGATTAPVALTAANAAPVFSGGAFIPTAVTNIGQGVPNGPTGLVQQGVLFGIPGGANVSLANLANVFQAISNIASGHNSRWSINPTVQGIITHRRARVLAEPTLTTISGERAAFLAGGEIPIVQSIATAGQAQQSVVFEPFGLRLNMIPVLLENGNVSLQVAPEERLLDQSTAINIATAAAPIATRIPGFTTRKTQTTVELKPGQELFISGLISANSGRELNKTPLLGEVPVLGALYRSKAFNKNESELVVSVRPEVILPGTPGQMKLPEEVSKVEGPRDVNVLQVEPTVVDERYMTSGRADRAFKIPGELPPGSAIPDNQ